MWGLQLAEINEVYRERDQLVAFLSRVYPSFLGPASDAEEGWNWIVYVDTPEGQLSWHVPDHELPEFFSHLNKRMVNAWDGHTTDEKYRRLTALRPRMQYFDGTLTPTK
jgi:hypothetical protein